MSLIGGQPAALVGGVCVCVVGPPDSIVKVQAQYLWRKIAARMGDTTAHGGVIVRETLTVVWRINKNEY
jgi:uncharacterized Zn-binding protein involved in type VI secretion